MSEDRRLLKDLQQGENGAWRQVYLKYKDDLLTVARSLVNDINTAEDCLQETFVLLASDGCKVRSNLKSYLLSCVVNRARDHLRRRDAQSKCQVNMSMQNRDSADPAGTLAANDEQSTNIVEFKYPETGPADIYEAGAPRSAQIKPAPEQ